MDLSKFPLLALVALLALAQLSVADPARPNVVMIIADDQTYRDFGFMGNAEVKTPHLDRLASQSARYVNGYVPVSVCSPSLATLLTGRYPHQHGIHFNHPPPGNSAFNQMTSRAEYEKVRSRSFALIQQQPTLPRTLADAGYRCLQTGKFWEGHFRNAGFTDGMTLFEPVPGQDFGGNRKLKGGELAAHGNGDHGLKIGRETMAPISDFLDDCGKDQPFFVWYAPYLPHQPHDSPQTYRDAFKGSPVPENRVPYYASILQFDDTVGELVRMIESRGLAGNTLFVFVIDNGWTPSTERERNRPEEFAHDDFSKRSPFEDGLRSPILLRWDNHIQPATHEQLISSVDLIPTILSVTNMAGSMNDLPGLDLLPSARGEEELPERPVFGEIYPGDASSLGHPSRDIAYRWVREGDYKLIVTHGDKPWGGFLKHTSLFDLKNDPGEKTDLSSRPELSEKRAHLRRLLDEWWTPGDDSAVPRVK